MSIQKPNKYFSKNLYKLVLTVASTSLVTVLSMTSISAQAAGLNDLFKNSSSAKSKFLPVDEAFQVVSNTKATSKGTRLSISFEITPGHYVYKDKLTLSFPKGISATPFTFNQAPVSIRFLYLRKEASLQPRRWRPVMVREPKTRLLLLVGKGVQPLDYAIHQKKSKPR